MLDEGTSGSLRPYVARLHRRWPADVAWQVLDGTLVSADISGFTALSERLAGKGREGAEELVGLLSACFTRMIHDAEVCGGDVVKFGGDALLVWFSGAGHTDRACRAALAMRRTINRPWRGTDGRRVPLGVSIGVHAGDHAFFLLRMTGGHSELVVAGPAATATVDAESAAASGEILLSPATGALVPASWRGMPRSEGVPLRRVTQGRAGAASPPPEPATDGDLSSMLPADQVEQILAGTVDEHRSATIAFLELSGLDALFAAHGPAEVWRRLQATAERAWDACRAFGVSWLASDVYHDGAKFILAAGAPVGRGDDEDRMLRALCALTAEHHELPLRVGVNRGFIFAGDLGGPTRRTYTTMGDATNVAARLMGSAGPGEVVASRAVLERCASDYDHEPLEPFMVKGKSEPMSASRVRRPLGPRSALDPVGGPLQGRRRELAQLEALAADAQRRRGAVILVEGERGVGKSRLALEVVRRSPAHLAFARCLPYSAFTPYAALGPMLRSVLGIAVDADRDQAAAALSEWLAHLAPDLIPFAPLLAPAIGGSAAETPQTTAIAPALRRTRTTAALVELVGRAVREPTTFLLDDLQHADLASREVLDALVDASAELPLLVIATAPPGEVPHWPRLVLEPLDDGAIGRIVEDVLGDTPVEPAALRAAVERSHGNPLFAIELTKALVADPGAPLPENLEALVATLIDALTAPDRRLLRHASVLGSLVRIEQVARVIDDAAAAREQRWESLDRFLEWVAPGLVRFRYDSYRRVAYEGLSFAARREAHGRVAAVLEAELVHTDREAVALVATHAARSGDEARTWRYATAAARAAVAAAMFGEAASLYELALDARRAAVLDERVAVAEEAGDACELAARFDQAATALRIALRGAPDDAARARLQRKLGEVHERLGSYAAAQRHYRQAGRIWSRVAWHEGLGERARLEVALAGIAYRRGRYADAWNAGAAALAQAQLVGDLLTAARAGLVLGNVTMHLGWLGVDVAPPDLAGLFRAAGDRLGEARQMSNAAVDRYFEGDWVEAERAYRDVALRFAEAGDVVFEAMAVNNLGELLSDQGRLDEAAAAFRSAGRSWRAVGYATGIALVESNLGRLAARRRRLDDALAHLRDARERFDALGSAAFALDARLRIGEARLLAGHRLERDDLATVAEAEAAAGTDPNLAALGLRLAAAHLAAEGDLVGAVERCEQSIELARSSGILFEEALSSDLRSRLADAMGDGQAAAHLARANAILDRLAVAVPPVLRVPGDVRDRRPEHR